MQVSELGTGVGAEQIAETLGHIAVRRQGERGPAGGLVGADQLRPEALAGRVAFGELGQLGDEVRGLANGQPRVEVQLLRLQALLVEAWVSSRATVPVSRPASGSPRHSARAAVSGSTRSAGSAVSAALRTNVRNTSMSTCAGSTWSEYPPAPVRSMDRPVSPRTVRKRETYTCSAARGVARQLVLVPQQVDELVDGHRPVDPQHERGQ